MIIFRYLAREIFTALFAVSIALLLIIMSGRFVKYLAQAAAGKLNAEILFAIMAYRLPGFLELVLPLGWFIAILLAYGRLYMESEMTVLSACGMGPGKLLAYTLVPAGALAAVVASLSLVVSPLGAERTQILLDLNKAHSEFDTLTPARFQAMAGGSAVTYAESLSENRRRMNGVFMAEMAGRSNNGQNVGSRDLAVIRAQSGEQVLDEQYRQRYLLLREGYRTRGRPGEAGYQVTRFDVYAQHLGEPTGFDPSKLKVDSKPTALLMGSEDLKDKAALQWRLSLPVLVVVVTLLAVPLSKTKPRQGRYVKMLPAILLYIIYLVSLNAARGAIEDGNMALPLGIWWVHGIFLIIAILLLSMDTLKTKVLRAKVP